MARIAPDICLHLGRPAPLEQSESEAEGTAWSCSVSTTGCVRGSGSGTTMASFSGRRGSSSRRGRSCSVDSDSGPAPCTATATPAEASLEAVPAAPDSQLRPQTSSESRRFGKRRHRRSYWARDDDSSEGRSRKRCRRRAKRDSRSSMLMSSRPILCADRQTPQFQLQAASVSMESFPATVAHTVPTQTPETSTEVTINVVEHAKKACGTLASRLRLHARNSLLRSQQADGQTLAQQAPKIKRRFQRGWRFGDDDSADENDSIRLGWKRHLEKMRTCDPSIAQQIEFEIRGGVHIFVQALAAYKGRAVSISRCVALTWDTV